MSFRTTLHGLEWALEHAPVTQSDHDTPPEGGEVVWTSLEEIDDLGAFFDWVCDSEERRKSFEKMMLSPPVFKAFEGWAQGAMDQDLEEVQEDAHD